MEKRYTEFLKREIPKKRLAKYGREIDIALQKRQALKEIEEYSSEISSVINDYNRKSCEETMMIKGFRKSNQETTNRKTHQENLAVIASRIAKGINRKQFQRKEVRIKL